MSLDKDRLKQKIKEAFQAEQSEEQDANASLENISDKLAQAIIEEIKELKINYTTGLIAPNGAVTGSLSNVTIE